MTGSRASRRRAAPAGAAGSVPGPCRKRQFGRPPPRGCTGRRRERGVHPDQRELGVTGVGDREGQPRGQDGAVPQRGLLGLARPSRRGRRGCRAAAGTRRARGRRASGRRPSAAPRPTGVRAGRRGRCRRPPRPPVPHRFGPRDLGQRVFGVGQLGTVEVQQSRAASDQASTLSGSCACGASWRATGLTCTTERSDRCTRRTAAGASPVTAETSGTSEDVTSTSGSWHGVPSPRPCDRLSPPDEGSTTGGAWSRHRLRA